MCKNGTAPGTGWHENIGFMNPLARFGTVSERLYFFGNLLEHPCTIPENPRAAGRLKCFAGR